MSAIIPPDVGAFAAAEHIETGLVTAAVTADVGLTQAGKEAAKGLLRLDPNLTMAALAALAREIAQDIQPLNNLLSKHGLSQTQYDFLSENNEFFKRTLASEVADWQSIGSTEKRVRLQALAALEDKMPSIASRMGAAAEKLGDVVEAAKFFAKVAGVDAGTGGAGAGGSGFTISIDLGADTRITIGPQEAAPAGQATDSEPPIRTITQGASASGGGQTAGVVPGGQGSLRQITAGQGTPPAGQPQPKG